MEHRLFQEFCDNEARGQSVRRKWFIQRGKEILNELEPNNDFKFSNHWFENFKKRFRIYSKSSKEEDERRSPPEDEAVAIFYQILLPFVTKADSARSKDFASVGLTIFGDCVNRVRPTIIFSGQENPIRREERDQYDDRTRVMFQHRAICDEEILKEWVTTEWGPILPDDPISKRRKILICDIERAQQTNDVKKLLREGNTTLRIVPQGCVSKILIVENNVNQPFKEMVEKEYEEGLSKDSDLNTSEDKSSERRILLTKCVGNAWSSVGEKNESLKSTFKKYAIFTHLSGGGKMSEEIMDEGLIKEIEGFEDEDDEDCEYYIDCNPGPPPTAIK